MQDKHIPLALTVEKLALKYAKTMGQLPAFLRESGIDRIVIHPGKRRWFVDRQEIIIYPDPGHKGPVKMLIHENAHLIDHRIIKDPDWEAAVNADDTLKAKSGWTDKFIFPPYEFKICSGMITNFHSPKSTLLMMATAYGGFDTIMKAYKVAIKEKYMFHTYKQPVL